MANYDKTLDASGLSCPLPILRTKQALRDLSPGQTLLVTATDPGAVSDFEAFSRATGHTLLQCEETDGKFHFVLQKRDISE